MIRRGMLALGASAAVASVFAPVVRAGTLDWDTTAGNGTIEGGAGTWDLSLTNWTPDGGASNVAWNNANNDTARFSGTGGTVTLGTGITAGGLVFDSGGYTVTASTLTLSGTPTVTVTNAADTATIASALAGTGGLTKEGAGKLTLTGASTFTGNITLNGGTLETNMAGGAATSPLGGQIGTTYRQVFFNNNATLRTTATWNDNTPSTTNVGIVFNFQGDGTIDVAGTSLTLDDGSGAGTGSGNSQLQGSGTLTKTGTGTLILGNGSSNFSAYTGSIVVNQGVVQIGTGTFQLGDAGNGTTVNQGGAINVQANSIGAEPLTISGTGASAANGALYSSTGTAGAATGPITLAGNVSVGGTGNLTLGGAISDNGNNYALTKVGTGTTILTSTSNAWGGGTTVSGGALRGQLGSTLPSAGNLTLNGGAFETTADLAIDLGTGAGQAQLPGGAGGFSGGLAGGVTVTLNGGSQLVWGTTPSFSPSALVVNGTAALGTMTLTNNIDLAGQTRTITSNSAAFDGVIAGVISNSGAAGAGVTINGTGVTKFGSVNTYDGTTTLAGGILSIDSDDKIPTGKPIVFNGGVLRVVGTTIHDFGTHTATFTNNAAAGVDVADATNTFTIGQNVATGTGGFVKGGAGTLNFGTGNTLTTTGTLTISGGGVLNLNQSNDLAIANAVTINGTGGTLNLTGGAKITLNTAATDIGTSGTLTINAVIANGTQSTVDFFNSGTGTVVLTGANTWTGVTNIQNAVVSVGSINSVVGGSASSNLGAPSSAANGVISIGSSATSTLRYTGTGETTDRQLRLAGATSGAVLDQSGTGLLKFGNPTVVVPGTASNSDQRKTLTLTGSTAGTGELAGVIPDSAQGTSGQRATSVVKSGTGTWTLSGVNTYTGATSVNQGKLAFGADQSLTGVLNFGSTNTTNTAGTLDLTTHSAAFGSLVAQTNTATASQVTIGAGQTLTVNGNVQLGSNAGSNTTTNITATGAGSFVVNNTGASGTFTVGGVSGTSGVGNTATADFSGLASMSVNLTGATSVLTVNPNISTGTTNVNGKFAVFKLAQTSTLTAATINVGVGPTHNSVAQVNQLVLGSVANTINANTFAIGAANRDVGTVTFAGPTGTITMRAQDGTGRTTAFNMGINESTGAGGVTDTNTFNVAGHSADLLLGPVVIGTQNRGIEYSNVFAFDTGTLDMTSLSAGARTAETTNGGGLARVTNVNVNLGGGTVKINNGVLQFGDAAGTYATAGQTVNIKPRLNVSGGDVTIGATSGVAIKMARVALTGTNTQAVGVDAQVNLTGGTTTLQGDIAKVGTTGTSSGGITNKATLTVNGGTLDMGGNKIGGASAAAALDVLNFQAGTLRNVGQINNGAAALVKTTIGTLVLDGTNTYTGGTQVDGGTLRAMGTGLTSVTGSGPVTVNGGGTLEGTGRMAGPLTVAAADPAGGVVAPGIAGGVTAGTLTVDGLTTFGDKSTFAVDLNSAAAYDQLKTNGVAWASASDAVNLALSVNFTPTVGAQFVILSDTSPNARVAGSGDFRLAGGGPVLTEGSTFTAGSTTFQITYAGGSDNNDVILTTTATNVPEPGVIGVGAIVGGMGLMRRRRRA